MTVKASQRDAILAFTQSQVGKKSPPPLSIDSHTIRKDTLIIPAGGYAVINFISDNPGYWYLHCHIEMHTLEGMSIIINEALEQQKKLNAPKVTNKCGNADLTGGLYKPLTSTIVAVAAE